MPSSSSGESIHVSRAESCFCFEVLLLLLQITPNKQSLINNTKENDTQTAYFPFFRFPLSHRQEVFCFFIFILSINCQKFFYCGISLLFIQLAYFSPLKETIQSHTLRVQKRDQQDRNHADSHSIPNAPARSSTGACFDYVSSARRNHSGIRSTWLIAVIRCFRYSKRSLPFGNPHSNLFCIYNSHLFTPFSLLGCCHRNSSLCLKIRRPGKASHCSLTKQTNITKKRPLPSTSSNRSLSQEYAVNH